MRSERRKKLIKRASFSFTLDPIPRFGLEGRTTRQEVNGSGTLIPKQSTLTPGSREKNHTIEITYELALPWLRTDFGHLPLFLLIFSRVNLCTINLTQCPVQYIQRETPLIRKSIQMRKKPRASVFVESRVFYAFYSSHKTKLSLSPASRQLRFSTCLCMRQDS